MSTTQTQADGRLQASIVFRAVFTLASLGFAQALCAQAYEPDADTAALYHFDTQTAEGTTPDSGPNGLDGTLEGAVLPAHVEATLGGYGFAYKFDGVDRGANNSRINMGTDSRVGMRGNGDWTLDVLVTVTSTLADDGYFRGIICRASSEGIDYSVSYLSWTNPIHGPAHEFWFTSGSPADYPAGYPHTALAFMGYMDVGLSYQIRAMVSSGVMTLTVNGQSTSAFGQTQPDIVPPTFLPVTADLTVGDACMEDTVLKPSELQIDEVRISNVARTDPPLIPPLPVGLPPEVPLDLGPGTDPAAFEQYRLEGTIPGADPSTSIPTPVVPTVSPPPVKSSGLRLR